MHGDQGWYSFKPGPYRQNTAEIWYMSMRDDGPRGNGPEPVGRVPCRGRARLARAGAGARQGAGRGTDRPGRGGHHDTRNPAGRQCARLQSGSVAALASPDDGCAAHHPRAGRCRTPRRSRAARRCSRGCGTSTPTRQRAGLPEGVAVLVEKMDRGSTTFTVVNLRLLPSPRRLIVRGGAYGEHRIRSARIGERELAVEGCDLAIWLAPGAGAQVVLTMECYSRRPTLDFLSGRDACPCERYRTGMNRNGNRLLPSACGVLLQR